MKTETIYPTENISKRDKKEFKQIENVLLGNFRTLKRALEDYTALVEKIRIDNHKLNLLLGEANSKKKDALRLYIETIAVQSSSKDQEHHNSLYKRNATWNITSMRNL